MYNISGSGSDITSLNFGTMENPGLLDATPFKSLIAKMVTKEGQVIIAQYLKILATISETWVLCKSFGYGCRGVV